MDNKNVNPGLLVHRNGDRAVQLVQSGKFKTLGSNIRDLSEVNEMFGFDQDTKHLGMLYTFDMIGTRMGRTNTVPSIMLDMIKNKAVINLESGGHPSFTYSTPIKRYNCLKLMRDTTASECSDRPGLADSPFPMYFNKALRKGDIVTYDIEDGIQIAVTEDLDIEPVGDMFRTYCKITHGGGELYFPFDKMKAGTEYYKVTHSMGEWSEEYSEFNAEVSTEEMLNEFTLYNHMGVSTATTLYGGERNTSGTSAETKEILDKIVNDVNMFQSSTNQPYDMLLMLDSYIPGETVTPLGWNIDVANTTMMSLFEVMAVAELVRMETTQLLWAKEARIHEINGQKRVNEGVYNQMRRGNIFTYAVPGGVDISFLQMLSDSVFRNNPDMKVEDHRMKLTVGLGLKENLDYIVQNHAMSVIATPAYQMLTGGDSILPTSPVSGSNLQNLSVEEIKFTKVYLPGVGYIEYEHDPSLDYSSGKDRFSNKIYANGGRSRSTYSGYLDARDSSATNAATDPNLRNASILGGEGALMSNSIFYVKPKRSLHWGWENGRMNSVSHLPEMLSHVSSVKTMTTEFWMHARSAGWIADKSAIFLIELEKPKMATI